MDKLWAPWRSKYIYLRKTGPCIFCKNENGTRTSDKKRYILKRTLFSFSMLNIFPYNNGHIMVAPYRHTRSLEGLRVEELLDLFKLVRESKRRLDKCLKPHGYNIGINIGKVAGAGFDGHIHVHIVPRWKGDTNFMPTVANAKIVSESLDTVYKTLKENAKTNRP